MRAVGLALALLLSGCAHDAARLAAIEKLDEPSKELLSKYRQFFTPLQQDRFLSKETFEERKAFVDALKIEERIAHYPKPIQDAIWSQDIIPGMDKPAVLLTWGSPYSRDIDDSRAESGVEDERWLYRRGDQQIVVVIINGYVTEVIEGKR